LNGQTKLAIWRTRFDRRFGLQGVRARAKSQPICPSGKIDSRPDRKMAGLFRGNFGRARSALLLEAVLSVTTTLIITAAFLLVGYFTGTLRPTGLLSRTPSILTGEQQRLLLKLWFLIAIPFGIFWTFGYLTIWQRLEAELEGTITARQDIPDTPHGPTAIYEVQRSDGSLIQYTVAPGHESLPATMPVGAYIAKQKWDLSYHLNGERVDDLPLVFFAIVFTIAGLCLIRAAVLIARGWRRGTIKET
jgi:hypothetical protein